MTEKVRRVIAAAGRWWENHKPLAYSTEQHFNNPIVNTLNGTEAELAQAVAALRKSNESENDTAIDSAMIDHGAELVIRLGGGASRVLIRDVHHYIDVFERKGPRARGKRLYNGGNIEIAVYILIHGEAKAREKFSWHPQSGI